MRKFTQLLPVMLFGLLLVACTSARAETPTTINGQSNGPIGYFSWGTSDSGLQVSVSFISMGTGASGGVLLSYDILIRDPQVSCPPYIWCAYTDLTGSVPLPSGALSFSGSTPVALNVDTSAVAGALNESCYHIFDQMTCTPVSGGRINFVWQPGSAFRTQFSGSSVWIFPGSRFSISGSSDTNGCRITTGSVLGLVAPAIAECDVGATHKTAVLVTIGH